MVRCFLQQLSSFRCPPSRTADEETPHLVVFCCVRMMDSTYYYCDIIVHLPWFVLASGVLNVSNLTTASLFLVRILKSTTHQQWSRCLGSLGCRSLCSAYPAKLPYVGRVFYTARPKAHMVNDSVISAYWGPARVWVSLQQRAAISKTVIPMTLYQKFCVIFLNSVQLTIATLTAIFDSYHCWNYSTILLK